MFNGIQTKINIYKNQQNYKHNIKKEQEFLSKLNQNDIQIKVSDKKETKDGYPDNIGKWSAIVEMTHNKSTFRVEYQYKYTPGESSYDIYTPDSATPEEKKMQASVFHNNEKLYTSESIYNCNIRTDGVDAIQESERNKKLNDKEEQLSLLVRIAAPHAKKIFEPFEEQKRQEKLKEAQQDKQIRQKKEEEEIAKKMALKKKLDNFFSIQ